MSNPKIYAQCSIGWSEDNPATRNISSNLIKNGWGWYEETILEPARQLGFDGGWLHNPFGCRADMPSVESDMRLDQRMLATQAGLFVLERGFTEMLTRQQKVWPMHVYYGGPVMEQGSFFKWAIETWASNITYRHMITTRYTRWCVQHALDARCAVGLDASGDVNPNSARLFEKEYYAVWKDLKKQATSVILEANPGKDCTWLYSSRHCLTSEWQQKQDANPTWAGTFAAPENLLTGERIVLTNRYYRNPVQGPNGFDETPENKAWSDPAQLYEGHREMSKWATGNMQRNRSIGMVPWWFLEHKVNVKEWLQAGSVVSSG